MSGRLIYPLMVAALCGTIAAQVAVKHPEGSLHGFLVLRNLQGDTLAAGDLTQTVQKGRITAHLSFEFKDGSKYDETSVYTQNRVFHLLSHHLVLRGPTFPDQIELVTDVAKSNATVRYSAKGKDEEKTEYVTMPPDLADGMVTTLLKNIPAHNGETRLSMIVATPKPRLVKLAVTAQGEETFSVAGVKRKANHFVVKIMLGGIAGAVAPLIGKEPPDIHIWVSAGEMPTFARWQGPMYANGPAWVIELASPVWKGNP